MLNQIITMADLGISVIPTNLKSKQPTLKTWKPYQTEIASRKMLSEWFGNGSKNVPAAVAGIISGNLQCVDCDGDKSVLDAFLARLGSVISNQMVIEQTQNNHYHILYRAAPTAKTVNGKLAWEIVETDVPVVRYGKEITPVNGSAAIALFEAKGQGGYFLSSPASGYSFMQGGWDSLPVLTADEHDTVISTAKSFDQKIGGGGTQTCQIGNVR